MLRLFYLPYHLHSASVRELQKVLGGLKILERGHFAYSPNQLVVNWGTGDSPYWGAGVRPNPRLLNHWSSVSTAVNKLSAFRKLKEEDVPTPAWTNSREEAERWIADGRAVFCRTVLSGMEGRGIVVAKTREQLVPAPLYTRHFQKDQEYRVHVFAGEVIDYAQKKLAHGAPADRSKFVRNTANGWIFARAEVNPPPAALEAAKNAVKALSLDFGAVDLAVRNRRVAVFEVNTAPGIEGTTVKAYSDAIAKYKRALEQ